MKSNIYVVTHKKKVKKLNKIYIPIQVGKTTSYINLGHISDDSEENIAYKNKSYCELTALYWIWKNKNNSDYVGLCHYRRYFSRARHLYSSLFYVDEKTVNNCLEEYDIILPYKFYWGERNVAEIYYLYGAGLEKDLITTRNVIIKNCSEYIEDFDTVMNSNSAYYCNMFITKREILTNYCKWLFDILEEIESLTDIKNYTPKEARVFGYLGELLLNVWVMHHKLKIKEIRMVNTEDSFNNKVVRRIKKILHI